MYQSDLKAFHKTEHYSEYSEFPNVFSAILY